MKKKILALTFAIALMISSVNIVNAKSAAFTLKAGGMTQAILKEGTHAPLHTSIVATYMNEPSISVYTSVRRLNWLNDWAEVSSCSPVITMLNYAYENNHNNVTGVADTMAVWKNMTAGTTISGRFYINSYTV